jgi:hypothetical protein
VRAVSAWPTSSALGRAGNYEAPRSWAERAYHKLIYYNKIDKGGHYAGLGTAATLFRRGAHGLQTTAHLVPGSCSRMECPLLAQSGHETVAKFA